MTKLGLGPLLALALLSQSAGAQLPSWCDSPAARRSARIGAASTAVAGNVALQVYFHNAWWSGERAERFWINYDWDMEFRDQDKFGHVWGGYHLTRVGADLLAAGCTPPGRAILWGAVYATVLQLQVEIWDGYQAKYGFSPPDLLANAVGTGFAVAHSLWPATQTVKPTYSYYPTRALRNGVNEELRPSVDYTGQTYWLSFDMESLLHDAWPGILRVSVGHSITDWVDPGTGDPQRAGRRILLSLDVDASKLPGDHPVWRRVKHELSYFRLPAPALQLYPSVRGVPWYR